MIKVLFTVWALLIAIGSFAQENAFSWAAGAVDSAKSVVQRLQTRQGLCIIAVSIGGRNHDFLLDTGAPTVVSKSIDDQLRSEGTGTIRVVDALGNAARVPVITVEELSVSGLKIFGLPALVYEDANPVFAALQVEGILGSNALQQLLVSVSFREKTVRFSSISSTQNAADATALNLSEDLQGSPFIKLSLEGNPGEFLFDSGFEGLLDLSDKAAEGTAGNTVVAVRALQGEEQQFTGINGGMGRLSKTVFVQNLRFPNATLHNVQATITGDSRSKIGAALFPLGDVTLDYPGRRFSFVPYAPK